MLKSGGKWSAGGYKSKIISNENTTALFEVKVYTPEGTLKKVIPTSKLIEERDKVLNTRHSINKGDVKPKNTTNNKFFQKVPPLKNTLPRGVRPSGFQRKPRQEKYYWTDEAKEKMMDWADGKTKITGTKMAKECGVSYHSFCWKVRQYRLYEQHQRQMKEVEGADDQSSPPLKEDKEHEK
tara:strand:- start:19155 stop:19697 length:543 start_codon:yes stop_codon:yes gene_type:complete